jgi:hypothetical protein
LLLTLSKRIKLMFASRTKSRLLSAEEAAQNLLGEISLLKRISDFLSI